VCSLTKDPREGDEPVSQHHPQRFVSRQDFGATSRAAPTVDLQAFRADQAVLLDHESYEAYEL
jgi:hypothetical protein